MENNKYYVPEIEEFHVGFEYEYNHLSYNFGFLNSTKGKWVKMTYTAGVGQDGESEHLDIEDSIEKKEIRVKTLHREDIESEGWKQSIITREDLFIFDSRYTLRIEDYLIVILNSILGNEKLFQGTIKNKSELRKIMKMLNIK